MSLKVMLGTVAVAALGLVGAIGSASAAPLVAADVEIWTGDTPGDTSTSIRQQALPSALSVPGLNNVSAFGPDGNAINYHDTTIDTIGGFFTTNAQLPPINCGAICQADPLSSGGFTHATLFEFVFTITNTEMLTIMHDDGVSLFVDNMGLPSGSDLLPIASAAPTSNGNDTRTLGPGTYELWYSEDNGLPANLTTNAVIVPAPIVGAGLPALIAACSGLVGFARRRRRRLA